MAAHGVAGLLAIFNQRARLAEAIARRGGEIAGWDRPSATLA